MNLLDRVVEVSAELLRRVSIGLWPAALRLLVVVRELRLGLVPVLPVRRRAAEVIAAFRTFGDIRGLFSVRCMLVLLLLLRPLLLLLLLLLLLRLLLPLRLLSLLRLPRAAAFNLRKAD